MIEARGIWHACQLPQLHDKVALRFIIQQLHVQYKSLVGSPNNRLFIAWLKWHYNDFMTPHYIINVDYQKRCFI